MKWTLVSFSGPSVSSKLEISQSDAATETEAAGAAGLEPRTSEVERNMASLLKVANRIGEKMEQVGLDLII